MTAQNKTDAVIAAEAAVNAEIGIDPEIAEALVEEGNFEAQADPRLAKLGELLDAIDGTDGEIAGLPVAEVLGDIADQFGDINASPAIRDLIISKFGEEKARAAFDQAFGATNEREAREPNFSEENDLMALLALLAGGDDDSDFLPEGYEGDGSGEFA